VLLLVLLGFFALSLLGLGCLARRTAGPPPLSGVLDLERGFDPPLRALTAGPDDAGTAASVPTASLTTPAADAGHEVFEDLEFSEDRGSVLSVPYSRIAALAMNMRHTCIVVEVSGMYQAILEGTDLQPLFRQLQQHRVRRLETSSLANGATYSIPVIPMSSLLQGRGPQGIPAPPHPMLVSTDDPLDEQPVLTRVRVCLDCPYHFNGCTGAYVADYR
jgi:hypothetical protein